jgi:sugar phosphate isomerase/epimerase
MLTKFALSNNALPAYDHGELLPQVRSLGFTGLEVAPGRVWADVERDATPAAVEAYRRSVEDAGLQVVGLHALLEDQPQLGVLRDGDAAQRSADYLVHLSEICRDLGGQTLILGAGRELNGVAPDQAWHQCLAFLEDLIPRIEDHGTQLCFAPLEATPESFCPTARECRIMAVAVDHTAFGLQLNTAALLANNEANHATFSAIYGHLDHFTISEAGRVSLGLSGRIDHAAMRRHLAAGNFPGWISVHQDATPDPLTGIATSAQVIDEIYRRPDNLSLELRRQAQAAAG